MFEMFHRTENVEVSDHEPSPQQKPFLIELQQQEKTRSGSFRPEARLQINPVFRTSGLLLALPPEELKSLLFLLTFVSPNGDCRALLPQLAAAMHLSPGRTRTRMAHLLSFRWQDEPLVFEVRAPSGLIAYLPHPRLVEYVSAPEPESEAEAPLTLQAAPRAEVIEHSRQAYARTRAEVERQIERQLGHDEPEHETEEGQISQEAPRRRDVSEPAKSLSLRRRLENNGLTRDQADQILTAYSRERIEQQLLWLPFRSAKNTAAFLTAAIENDYEEPRVLRSRIRRPSADAEKNIGRDGSY